MAANLAHRWERRAMTFHNLTESNNSPGRAAPVSPNRSRKPTEMVSVFGFFVPGAGSLA
jgi:hypothetical protein